MATVCTPVARSMVPASGGLVLAGDPAALTNWPDAVIAAGFPDPATLITSLSLDVTAHRPLTASQSFGLQVLAVATGVEIDTSGWSGATGSNDAQPGIDYWRLDNWDTSTGVYGWA